ncbi:MAG: helix-turn-helix transcriptional regulator [Bacteroidota bacterium]
MKISKKGEYYGEKRSEVDLTAAVLSEYDYIDKRTDWHYHENPYFMYVIDGNLLDINKKNKKQLPSGSLIFHNWQEAHYNTKETAKARGFHVEFPRQWFEQRKLNIDLWEGSRVIEHPKLHQIIGQLYYEFKCKDSYSDLAVELLILQLCENTQTAEFSGKQEPTWVESLREVLHEETEDLNLARLSQKVGVHPVHISRAFPKYFGGSLGDYLRQQKIKQSIGYILKGKHSLTDIANMCGFSDQSHFTRTFKSYLNQTPRSFRKQVL